MTTMDIRGRTALVTGAGTGIGRSVVRGLVERGVKVAGVGRRREPLDALARELDGTDRFLALTGDVGDEADARRLIGEARAALGPVTLLVNNAGTATFTPIVETTAGMFDQTLATNLRGPFLLTREALPVMLESGEGHILMNVSVAAVKAFSGCGAYGASKAGLLGFCRVLREETRGTGVRVTALIPGATDTPIWGSQKPDPRRLMSPESVADAAIWAMTSDPAGVPEEIVLRPPDGDI